MADPTQLIARTGVSSLGARLNRNKLAVLAYHGVPSRDGFARQLDELADYGTFVSPGQVRDDRAAGRLPERSILLTFDDGDPTVLHNAAPVLADRGVEAIIFVVGGLLDTSTPFWWDEVARSSGDHEVRRLKTVPNRERLATLDTIRSSHGTAEGRQLTTADLVSLQSAGFEIGNHTGMHPCLDQCEPGEAVDEVIAGHQALVDRGITPTAFAYPNGNLDDRVEPTLRELGYDLGFVFDHRHATPSQDRLRLSRLRLDADASPARSRLIVSGVHGALMRARGRGRGRR